MRDAETNTISTTWSRLLPRMTPLDAEQRGRNAKTVEHTIDCRSGELVVRSQHADHRTGRRFETEALQERNGYEAEDVPGSSQFFEESGGCNASKAYEELRIAQKFGNMESEHERPLRELKKADEHLARVRDGRGYVNCNLL